MKKLLVLIFCLSLFWNTSTAQTPSAFKYQAVVRTNLGQIIVNQQVGFKISILKTTATGTAVYVETQTAQTNTFGLVTFEIGRGTVVSGTFASINWGSDAYFVKIALDANNSGTFSDIGTSQLLAVPYSLYAEKAGNGFSGVYTDLTAKPVLATVAATGSYNDLTGKPALVKVATTGAYADITGTPTLATVATSGSYNDLTNKPNFIATAAAPKSGDILYHDGTSWLLLAKGTDNQVLKLETGKPKWKPINDFVTVNPVAVFTTSHLLAPTSQTISVDATASIDDADLITALQVRWRWEDGGTFTAWTTTKTATNAYLTEGSKNITLEVKDTQGNVGTTSKGVTINNTQFMPLVFTNAASNVTANAATCGGNVVASGGINVTARGICWSTAQNPTVADTKTTDGTGLGYYTSSMTPLVAGTTYYIRAYATNSIATNYGNQVTVQAVLTVVTPTVTTTAATNITSSAATTGGNVTATGGADITARGVCWSINQNPTIADSKTSDGTGTGSYPSQITGLTPGTFYVRAYATNSAGTGYGTPQITITTAKIIPVITTKDPTEISTTGAVSGGNIISNGGGTISALGICWSESPNPTITDRKSTSNAAFTSFNAAINLARPNTTYYIKAYATNEIGTSYGEQKTFKTSDAAYYQSFESATIPVGWSGTWCCVNEEYAVEGNYSLRSMQDRSSHIKFTYTSQNPGQISFYYLIVDRDKYATMQFYIDDILISTYPMDNTGWKNQMVNIAAGTHTYQWNFGNDPYNSSHCRIDHVIITK